MQDFSIQGFNMPSEWSDTLDIDDVQSNADGFGAFDFRAADGRLSPVGFDDDASGDASGFDPTFAPGFGGPGFGGPGFGGPGFGGPGFGGPGFGGPHHPPHPHMRPPCPKGFHFSSMWDACIPNAPYRPGPIPPPHLPPLPPRPIMPPLALLPCPPHPPCGPHHPHCPPHSNCPPNTRPVPGGCVLNSFMPGPGKKCPPGYVCVDHGCFWRGW